MRLPRVILLAVFAIFGLIGIVGAIKKIASNSTQDREKREVSSGAELALEPFPFADSVERLFSTGPDQFPIVETISYTSRVPWLKGRPAWIADYAAYYGTSRYFIARSLNGKADYQSQKVSFGSKFSVFRKERPIHFYLLVDLSRKKMGLYYHDLQEDEKVLVKTYSIGVSPALSLGRFTLGQKVAVYKAAENGVEEKAKLLGTRSIPLETEDTGKKGFVIHGAPWVSDSFGLWEESKELISSSLDQSGICLLQEDMEELFAIVIPKPTFVDIVRDFRDAKGYPFVASIKGG